MKLPPAPIVFLPHRGFELVLEVVCVSMPVAYGLANFLSQLALAWRFCCWDIDCRPSVVWGPMDVLMPEGAPRVPAHCGSAVDDLTTKRIGQ